MIVSCVTIFGLNRNYDFSSYLVPESLTNIQPGINPGDLVRVPWSNWKNGILAIVVSIENEAKDNESGNAGESRAKGKAENKNGTLFADNFGADKLNAKKLKEVQEIVVPNFISEADLKFYQELAIYYGCSSNLIYHDVLPAKILESDFLGELKNSVAKGSDNFRDNLSHDQFRYLKPNFGFGNGGASDLFPHWCEDLYREIIQKDRVLVDFANNQLRAIFQAYVEQKVVGGAEDKSLGAIGKKRAKKNHQRIEEDFIFWGGEVQKQYLDFQSKISQGQKVYLITSSEASLLPFEGLEKIVVINSFDQVHTRKTKPYINNAVANLLRAKSEALEFVDFSFIISPPTAMEIDQKKFVAEKSQPWLDWVPKVEIYDDQYYIQNPEEDKYGILPSKVYQQISQDIKSIDPVLIIAPFDGVARVVICSNCKQQAKCEFCPQNVASNLIMNDKYEIICSKCKKEPVDWTCPKCGGKTLQAIKQGSQYIFDELKKSFPRYEVLLKKGQRKLKITAKDKPLIIVADPSNAFGDGFGQIVILHAQSYFFSRNEDVNSIFLNFAFKNLYQLQGQFNEQSQGQTLEHSLSSGILSIIGNLPPIVKKSLLNLESFASSLEEYKFSQELNLPPAYRLLSIGGKREVIQEIKSQLEEYFKQLGLERAKFSISQGTNNQKVGVIYAQIYLSVPNLEQNFLKLGELKRFLGRKYQNYSQKSNLNLELDPKITNI